MNSRILLAVITLAILSSCSTAYKAQTPDDVYYSPARPQEEYVAVETQKDRDAYRYEEEDTDDRYLRWKVRNRSRWSNFDDYSYDWYDYRYGGNWAYNSPWNRNLYWNSNTYWNNYWYWNQSYNPYCGKVIVVTPKAPAYNQVVRNYRPGTYNNRNYNNSNTPNSKVRTTPGTYRPSGSYNNSNSNTLGNSIRKVFNNSSSGSSNNNNNSSSSDRPSRTYTPPTNNSSSTNSSGSNSSGSSNNGGGVTRPGRGGR